MIIPGNHVYFWYLDLVEKISVYKQLFKSLLLAELSEM